MVLVVQCANQNMLVFVQSLQKVGTWMYYNATTSPETTKLRVILFALVFFSFCMPEDNLTT